MQISIKEIKHENKTSQAGKDFVSCKIKTWSENQQKDLWISGFGNSITETWAVGDTVDVDLEQKGEYWNFNLNNNSRPSKTALDVLKEISAKLDVLIGKDKSTEELAKELGGEVVPKINNKGQEENPIDVSEIPF
uniref:Uncharacterized protein n=1 Tax=viral metagenome TaxID=1070528 RepID=A0A6H1ZKY7_9ZZZZ